MDNVMIYSYQVLMMEGKTLGQKPPSLNLLIVLA